MASRKTRTTLGKSGHMPSTSPQDPLSGFSNLAGQGEALALRKRLKSDFGLYFVTCFKDAKGNTIKLKPFHERIIRALQTKPRVLLNLFRGSGKSTLLTQAYAGWYLGNDRDKRVIIACKNESLAKEFLRRIDKDMRSDWYIEIFGNLVPAERTGTWNETEKIVAGRSAHATGLSLFGIGAGAASAGRRADLIIVDDCADAKNSSTEIQRGHLSTWFFEELEPVLEPGGTIAVVGTKWHPKDIYSEVDKAWSARFGTENYEFILVPVLTMIQTDEGEVPVSVWEERYPTDYLLSWRDAKPLEFAQQMMCDPVDTALAFLQLSWLENNLVVMEDLDTEVKSRLLYYFGVDPSWSEKDTADYFAICVGAKDPVTNLVYVIDLVRGHADPDKSWQLVTEVAAKWWPQKVNMEANAAQAFLVNKLQRNSLLAVNPVKTVGSKTERFANMSVYFTTGRVKIAADRDDDYISPKKVFDPLFYEWSIFRGDRSSDHDDCLDALDLMLKAAAYGADPIENFISTNNQPLPGEPISVDGQPLLCGICREPKENLHQTPEGLYCSTCLALRRRREGNVTGDAHLRRHYLGY